MKREKNFKIEGYVDFMVCDDAQCLPPDYVEFSFNIPEHSINSTDSKESEETGGGYSFRFFGLDY